MATEHQTIEINTPKKDQPIYILLVTYKDDVLGSLKFSDSDSIEAFKKNYSNLSSGDEWGFMTLEIDTGGSK